MKGAGFVSAPHDNTLANLRDLCVSASSALISGCVKVGERRNLKRRGRKDAEIAEISFGQIFSRRLNCNSRRFISPLSVSWS
jgi:hypothetical protein